MSTTQQTSDASTAQPLAEPFPLGTPVALTGQSISDDDALNMHVARPGLDYVVYGYVPGEPDDNTDPAAEGARPYYLLDIADLTFGGRYWAFAEHVEALPAPQPVIGPKTWTVTLTDADLGWMAQRFHDNADGLTHAGTTDKPRIVKALAAVLDEAARRGTTGRESA